MSDARTSPRFDAAWSALLAIGGGLAWAACFQKEPHSALAWLALTPLVALVYRPRPLVWGFVHGLTFWVASMPWIASTVSTFGGLPTAVGAGLLFLLAAYLAVETAVWVFLGQRWLASGRSELHLSWLLPAAWVALEAQRFFYLQGFPWNLAALAFVDMPGALPTSSWIGASGISFLVVTVNVALALALVRGRWRSGLGTALAVLLLLVVGGRFAGQAQGIGGAVEDAGSSMASAGFEVRLIQPNSPISWDDATLRENYQRLLRLSHEACDRPALLIWPESAAWPYSWESSPRLRADVAALARRGCSVLLGSPLRTGSADSAADGSAASGSASPSVENALFVVGVEGPGPSYAKRRLVPFGEYVPFEDFLPFAGKLARNVGDFAAGTDVALLGYEAERLGAAICYEVIFAAPVAEQARAGATVLVTITNDAWYGDSSAPWQHLRAARFRAAETRRPLLRAALTGVSAWVDERGRLVSSIGVDEQGVLSGRVFGSTARTPFVRLPWAVVGGSVLLVGFAIIQLLRSRRFPSRSEP